MVAANLLLEVYHEKDRILFGLSLFIDQSDDCKT